MLREVQRTMIPQRLLPILHQSTYTAWKGLASAEEEEIQDPPSYLLEAGYLNQSELVSVASDAILQRAIQERVSILVEGVHVHPGFARRIPDGTDAVIVQVMLAVLRRKDLKKRIKGRGRRHPNRRAERYLSSFDSIWEIQSYLLAEADRIGVPIVVNDEKENCVHEVVRVVMGELEADYALHGSQA